MNPVLIPVVEGKKSERAAVPILLRRILHEFLNTYEVEVGNPIYQSRGLLAKEEELIRILSLVRRERLGASGVLVVFDSDDDLPCVLAPNLLKTATANTPLPVSIVLANKEFECWFLGAKESLRGIRGIRKDAVSPTDPESIRGAKERLTANMEQGCRYIEVDDQPAFAAKMDLDMARRNCPSFDKLIREVETLVAKINASQTSN